MFEIALLILFFSIQYACHSNTLGVKIKIMWFSMCFHLNKLFVFFQLYYRAIREIQAGEEMLLYAKDGLFGEADFNVFQKKTEGECNNQSCPP